jgi:hypothetical protein
MITDTDVRDFFVWTGKTVEQADAITAALIGAQIAIVLIPVTITAALVIFHHLLRPVLARVWGPPRDPMR